MNKKLRGIKKSQVAIFLIIAIIIIVLIIFLVSSDKFNKEDNLENAKINSNLEGNHQLLLIKEHIDSCFKKQLRRATIIAGLRGGFIYDNGEYYSPGVLFEKGYSQELLGNLNLNNNFLNGNVLMFSQVETYVPKIDNKLILNTDNGEKVIYPKSIKEEFEDFILKEFLTCVDLDSYKNEGYDIEYEKFAGKINKIDENNNLIYFEDLEGNIGDEVSVIFNSKELIGNITNFIEKDNKNLTIVKYPINSLTDLVANTDFLKLKGLNLNTSIVVKVNFEDERITSKINFPIKVSKGNNSIKYVSSSESLNVRFKQLLSVIDKLIYKKYMNKSIKLDNVENLNTIINNDPLLKRFNFSRIRIYKTPINDSKEEKLFVYSIVDNDSKILGSPFIFNFAYENSAPEIDLSSLGEGEVFEDNSVLFVVSKNHPFTMNLQNLTSDKQLIDNYLSHYIPINYDGPDGKFSLDYNGTINFIGYREKKYSFDISVTDNEATRTKTFVILTGFPDNENNSAAFECFKFKNYDIPGVFPIEDTYRNQIFDLNSNSYHKLFAYQLFLDPVLDYTSDGIPKLKKSTISFSESCVFNKNMFDVSYNITNLNGGSLIKDKTRLDDFGTDIEIENDKPIKISISITDKSGNSMTEPFTLEVYPTNCLGPNAILSNDPMFKKYGGDNSCCNMKVLNDSLTKGPESFIKANSNLIGASANHYALNAEMYFCYMPQLPDPKEDEIGNVGLFDFTQKSIWDSLGSQATNLFKGKIQAICQGKYPVSSANIEKIEPTGSPSMNLGYTSHVGLMEEYMNKHIPVSLEIINSTETCEFCYITNMSLFSFIINKNGNNWVLDTGFIDDNPTKMEVGTSVLLEDPGVNLFAENKWYGIKSGPIIKPTTTITSPVQTGFGKNNDKDELYLRVYKPLCELGKTYSGFDVGGNNLEYTKIEDVNKCEDWYVSYIGETSVVFDKVKGSSSVYNNCN